MTETLCEAMRSHQTLMTSQVSSLCEAQCDALDAGAGLSSHSSLHTDTLSTRQE